MGTAKALQQCKEAEELGADAILAFNPQGFRPYTSEELIEHFMTLTGATKIPLIAYARADDLIPFDVIRELVEKKRLDYMKYAWRSCDLLINIVKNFSNKLMLFCGADMYTLRYLLLGCKGIMTATAAILPKENVTLLSMVQDGDIEGAREYYNERILPWNDIGFYENWQSVHKFAFQCKGLIKSARGLSPQATAGHHQMEEVKWLLNHFGITG
jgi:4-hydroxy-tetrahydrodipicolinate synthase